MATRDDVSYEVHGGIVATFLFRAEGVSGERTYQQISAHVLQERMEVWDHYRESMKPAHQGLEPKCSDARRELFSEALIAAG
jgi:hypothetical protein